MSPLSGLSPAAKSLLGLWSYIMVLAGIAGAVIGVRQKRTKHTVLFLPLIVVSYLLTITVYITGLSAGGSQESIPAARLAMMPWGMAVLVLILLSAAGLQLLISLRRLLENEISPMSIKESLDELPAGLCFYREDGTCVLVNKAMESICRELTGRDLQDGRALWDAVSSDTRQKLSDGSVVQFSRKSLDLSGRRIWELSAFDVTELAGKSELLKRDSERVKKLSEEMKEYGKNIDETVRRQEILKARASVHDEMNRMILSTENALYNGSEKERRKAMESWKINALQLIMETGGSPGANVRLDIKSLAGLIGINVCTDGLPEFSDPAAGRLFVACAKEAMINAVKHAGAGNLFIEAKRGPDGTEFRFTNDGRVPEGDIIESGGLRLLRERIESAGGSLRTESFPRFALVAVIPDRGEDL